MTVLHKDIQRLYDLWLSGRCNIGYNGPIGNRCGHTSNDQHIRKINALIEKKNNLLRELVDRINENSNPKWKERNDEYIQLCEQLEALDNLPQPNPEYLI